MKVAIVVTHLLGTGHLARALTLGRAFVAGGHDALVISGGMPVAHLGGADARVFQLPPLRSDGVDFSTLLDDRGDVASAEYLAEREMTLIRQITQYAPDALITELFPFGRRILKTEFQALLEQARRLAKPPQIFASIRDILAPPSKPKKAVFAQDMVDTFYDAVLVHSDPQITPLDLSWPVTGALRPKLRYTGFVTPAPAPAHPQGAGRGEVLVSAGGGDVGDTLFACALEAAAADGSRPWRLLVGGQNAPETCAKLMRGSPANVTAEPARPDFRQMLHHAAASVSLCGYNTALDILQSGCPAVFVPFDAGNEVEQTIRANAMAGQPGIETVATAELAPRALLDALDAARRAPRRAAKTDHMQGAEETVRIVAEICRHADAR